MKKKEHYNKIWIFLISTLIVFVFLLVNNHRRFLFGDSAGYEAMALVFYEQGLLNFNPILESDGLKFLFAVRGYGWPYLIAILKFISFNNTTIWLFFYSIYIVFGLQIVMFDFIERLFEVKTKTLLKLLPILLVLYYWPGLVIYPLSDLSAMIFILIGLDTLLISIKSDSKNKKIIFTIISGLTFGIAYYIRSGTKVAILLSVLILILSKRKFFVRIMYLFPFFCGIFISMIPQVLININLNNKLSYEVPIHFTTNIAEAEYYNGISWMRYETNYSSLYGTNIVLSTNPITEILFQSELFEEKEIGPKEIVEKALSYPLETLGIFATKFANYIDPRYGELYIQDIYVQRNFVVVSNFILWFIFIYNILISLRRKKDHLNNCNYIELYNLYFFIRRYGIITLTFFSPTLLYLAGTHVEARYIFPLYYMMYVYIITFIDWNELWTNFKENSVSCIISFFALFSCCCAIWNYTFANIENGEILYQENNYKEIIGTKEEFIQNYVTGKQEYEQCIWKFEYADFNIKILGYNFIYGIESTNTELVLLSETSQYLLPINNYTNISMQDYYGTSEYNDDCFSYIGKLPNIANGNYEIGLLTEVEDEYVYCPTGYVILIE